MAVTRAIACILLTAQASWVVAGSLWTVAVDGPADELPVDSLLVETEEESQEDRLKVIELDSFHGLVAAVSVKHAALFSGKRIREIVRLPEQVVIDLARPRAPPSLLERLA